MDGCGGGLDGDQPAAFVLSKLAIDYLRPARIDDELVVRTRYRAMKGPRLLIAQDIVRGDEVLCRGAVEAVCIHLDGRPRRPSAALRERVGPWLTGEP